MERTVQCVHQHLRRRYIYIRIYIKIYYSLVMTDDMADAEEVLSQSNGSIG